MGTKTNVNKRKLVLRHEVVCSIGPASLGAQATNSSQCGACSCEQHCEQVYVDGRQRIFGA